MHFGGGELQFPLMQFKIGFPLTLVPSRVHNIKSERECPTGINSLNALRQVMMQQAVFTLCVKHFDLEHKSRDTHYTNSAIISIKQGCLKQ